MSQTTELRFAFPDLTALEITTGSRLIGATHGLRVGEYITFRGKRAVDEFNSFKDQYPEYLPTLFNLMVGANLQRTSEVLPDENGDTELSPDNLYEGMMLTITLRD